MSEVDTLVQEVERARASLLESVADVTETQGVYTSRDADWSIAQILEHLFLAEVSGVSKMWAAVDAHRRGDGWTGDRPHAGKPIEQVVAETWKTAEVAPGIVEPQMGGPLDYWRSATRSLTPVLADLGTTLASVALEDVVYPHPISGPLDARQRLEFLRFHIERHAGQIDRIRSSDGFPV